MELFDDLDAQRMQDDAKLVVTSLGTTRLLLRQPLPPSSTVKNEFSLDQDYKTPNGLASKIPYRERIFEAKIRSINDYEASQTGVGEVQIGDLWADIDPYYYDDPIQPIQTMDEIRFQQSVFVQNAGRIERDWDYIVQAVIPSWGRNACVKLKLHLRRKQIATSGGSKLSPV